jgi:hypothetical protein
MSEQLWESYKQKFSLKGISYEPIEKMQEKQQPIDKIQEAAKEQITTLTTLFTAGYFGLVSITDLSHFKATVSVHIGAQWSAILIFFPMLLWLLSPALANLLYLSDFNDGLLKIPGIEMDYTKTTRHLLTGSIWAMFLGLVILLVDLRIYAIYA